MVMSLGAKLLRGWMVINAVLDLMPLGLIPLYTGQAGMLGDMSPYLGINHLALRLSAWSFLKDAAPRFAAGALAFTAGGAPAAVDALALYSYASEFLFFLGEVLLYKTTTFSNAAGCFVIPPLCCLGLASGLLTSTKRSRD